MRTGTCCSGRVYHPACLIFNGNRDQNKNHDIFNDYTQCLIYISIQPVLLHAAMDIWEVRMISWKGVVLLLRYFLVTVLLLSRHTVKSECVFQPSQCPTNCQCSAVGSTLHVNCSSSGLDTWPESLQVCSALHLDMSGNNLKTLEYKSYMNVSLTIDVSYNSIASISQDFASASALPKLKHLYLQNNELTSLTKKEVTFMKALNTVSLHANHWHCQCGIDELHDWINEGGPSTDLIDKNNIRCFTPRPLHGRAIGELDEHVICKDVDRHNKIPAWVPIVITIGCLLYLVIISAIAMCIVLRRRVKVIDTSNPSID